MTMLGKIFTVLIFVMSVVFMSLSLMVFATHKNWQQQAIAVNTQLTEVKNKNTVLEKEKEEYKTRFAAEQAARAYALAALQSKLLQIEEQTKAKEAELQQLQAAEATQVALIKTSSEQQAALEAEVKELRDKIVAAQRDRDNVFLAVVSAYDSLHDAIDKERVLKERHDQLVKDATLYKMALDASGIDPYYVLASGQPPKLDGVVLAVGKDKDNVEVSVGSDDGLKEGHLMEVFRNYTYLGRIKILKVEPNRAVGRVINEHKKGPIKVNDRVITKLI